MLENDFWQDKQNSKNILKEKNYLKILSILMKTQQKN